MFRGPHQGRSENRGNLHPLLKGETLKKQIRDNFENPSGGPFQNSLKNGVRFQTILKKGFILKLSLKKYPRPGPGGLGQGPGPRPPWGICIQTQFEMTPFLKKILERTPLFKLFWKWALARFSKLPCIHFSKFHYLSRDANR